MRSFTGGRLTSLKLGSTSAGLVGVSGIFLKARIVKSLLFSVMVLTLNTESMHAVIYPSVVFDRFCVFIDDGVIVCGGPWRGFKFPVTWRASKLSFRSLTKFFKQKEQFDPNLC